MTPRTLLDKVWSRYVVHQEPDGGPALLHGAALARHPREEVTRP